MRKLVGVSFWEEYSPGMRDGCDAHLLTNGAPLRLLVAGAAR